MILAYIFLYLVIGFCIIPTKYCPPFKRKEDSYIFTLSLIFWPLILVSGIFILLCMIIKFFAEMIIWIFNGGLKEKFKEDEKTN